MPERARPRCANCAASSGNDRVEFVQADLSLIRNVDALAAQVWKRWPRLHYLVLCAGIMRGRHTLTSGGNRNQFRGQLSQPLCSRRSAAPKPCRGRRCRRRCENTGCQRRRADGKIRYDDVNLTRRFGILRAVSQFCEANDVFVLELARQMTAAVSPAVHYRQRAENRRRANQYTLAVSGMDEAAGAARHGPVSSQSPKRSRFPPGAFCWA